MLKPGESELRFELALEKKMEEIEKKIRSGEKCPSLEELEAVFSSVCKEERIYVSDGYCFWNPWERPIHPLPIRGHEPLIQGLMGNKESKRVHWNESRKVKRTLARGITRTCAVCGKEFYPRRSDAKVCNMMTCKKGYFKGRRK